MDNFDQHRIHELNGLKVIILTRSCNKSLFIKSGQSIKLPFEKRRIKYKSAEGYLYAVLKSDADIAINIDEDAFILDNNKLFDLLLYMVKNGYVNCGFPDGGVLPIRFHNPLITNPFFNILDLRILRNKFNFIEIKKFSVFNQNYIINSPVHLLKTEYKYDMYEPFYPFFLWISQNFKVLYLDAEKHPDGITSILKDHVGNPFLLHSWYSRSYNIDNFHTERINSLINELGIPNLKVQRNLVETFLNEYYMPLKSFIRIVLKKFQIIKYI